MVYLLDSDTLIFLIRGIKIGTPRNEQQREMRRAAERILKRCRETSERGDVIALSVITVAELEFGARRGGRYEQEMAAMQKILGAFEVLNFDAASAQEYGVVREQLEGAGVPIGSMDLLIAAHARSVGAILVTNNQAHFRRVAGLKVEVW